MSGDESGPGHPDDGGGSSSGDSEEGRGPDSKRPSRKRSRVLRFEAGSATIDNKLRQIGHGFVPVGRSPGASPGTSPDNADGGGGAAYDSYASPRNPGQPHGSPTRRRSNSIMSPSGALAREPLFVGRSYLRDSALLQKRVRRGGCEVAFDCAAHPLIPLPTLRLPRTPRTLLSQQQPFTRIPIRRATLSQRRNENERPSHQPTCPR